MSLNPVDESTLLNQAHLTKTDDLGDGSPDARQISMMKSTGGQISRLISGDHKGATPAEPKHLDTSEPSSILVDPDAMNNALVKNVLSLTPGTLPLQHPVEFTSGSAARAMPPLKHKLVLPGMTGSPRGPSPNR